MRKVAITIKRGIALLLATATCAISLSGCGYESFDDYLEALGIKDPMEYDLTIFETTDSDDVNVDLEDVPAQEAEQAAEEIPFDAGTLENSENEVAGDM